MSDFFEGEKIEPELLETPWGEEARRWLQDLPREISLPLLEIAGMTETERAGQGILAGMTGQAPEGYRLGLAELEKTLTGEYDPRTSPFYQGLREESLMEEEQAVSGLRRGSQMSGMFYSSPSVRAEGELRQRFGAGRMSMLGRLYEGERERRFRGIPLGLQFARERPELQQLAAIQQYGALPRQIEDARQQALFQQRFGETMFPYMQGQDIAGTLMGYQPWNQPQYQASPFSQIIGPLAQVASAFI